MNVLVASNLFWPTFDGGAEKVARLTAESLAARHSVTVLTTGVGKPYRSQCAGYDIIPLRYQNLYPYPYKASKKPLPLRISWHLLNSIGGLSRKTLRKQVTQRQPDVVYLHNAMAFLPQLSDVCEQLRIPVVAHLHDYSYVCSATSMYKRGSNCGSPCTGCRLFTRRFRQCGDSFAAVVSVSRFVEEIYQSFGVFKNAKWYVINNVEAQESPGFVRRIRQPGDPISFGYIGAISPHKGIEDLVSAFSRLERRSARLVVAGNGEDEFVNRLKAMNGNENIRWLGYTAAEDFYPQIDCLVVPSRWQEPFGLIVAESINRGIPVIGARSGAITELLETHGGIPYDPNETGALQQTLEDFVSEASCNHAPPAPAWPLTQEKARFGESIERVLESVLT